MLEVSHATMKSLRQHGEGETALPEEESQELLSWGVLLSMGRPSTQPHAQQP